MKILLIAMFLISVTQAETCFPENNLSFPVDAKNKISSKYKGFLSENSGEMSEEDFHQALSLIETTYGPVVEKATGKRLIVQREWDNPRVNASATRDDVDNPVVVVNGGLARHPMMTFDALLLLVCHEIGHHLGGAPRQFRGTSQLRSWSSAEGQADYFSTGKCLPKILVNSTDDENKNAVMKMNYADYQLAKVRCESDLCIRMATAGLVTSRFFASLKNGTMPSLDHKDETKVDQINMGHPAPQCRLDTYVAGANCIAMMDVLPDSNDPRVGACVNKSDRPACWFKY
jgi:hypothetical protein